MKQRTYEFLIKEGLKPGTSAFNNFGDCIDVLIQLNKSKVSLEREVYPVVAQKSGMAQRSIREGIFYLIEMARTENGYFCDRFGGYPTPKTAMCDIATRILYEISEEEGGNDAV